MSVAIVLPARLKSTRLPNKLLLSATGKTLLEHTIDRAKLAQAAYPELFTTIRVACDDEQLIRAGCCRQDIFGAILEWIAHGIEIGECAIRKSNGSSAIGNNSRNNEGLNIGRTDVPRSILSINT